VASSSAAERAEGSRAKRRRRGEIVLLTFSQQGWGECLRLGGSCDRCSAPYCPCYCLLAGLCCRQKQGL